MEIDVKLPELGENIESGSIASILVAVGEHVEKDDPILELETDKAVVEVPSSHSGLISTIHINTGDPLNVGDTIRIKGHTTDQKMEVKSIQIEHKNVETAKKGDSIGIEVTEKARRKDKVYRIVN